MPANPYLAKWDDPTNRTFETGLDRGMIYPRTFQAKSLFWPMGQTETGYEWSGLTSVNIGSEYRTETVLYDGAPISQKRSSSGVGGVITAFSYPDIMAKMDGTRVDDESLMDGVTTDNGPPQYFALSYRTKKGDGLNPEAGYKIHLIFNLVATPSPAQHDTQTEEQELVDFEWGFRTVPEVHNTYVAPPTTRFTFDSTKISPTLMYNMERHLYGHASMAPYGPVLFPLWRIQEIYGL